MSKFKELGLTTFKAEGIEMTNVIMPDHAKPQPAAIPLNREVPDLKAEEIVAPMSLMDELDEDDVLYWSTPFYDEIQARKEAMKQAKESGTNEITD